jgi:hypothetical protein
MKYLIFNSILIVFLSFAILSYFSCLYFSKNITPDSQNSDAMKQVRAAAMANTWRWPSDMHKFTIEKAYMKDVGLILLVIFQRLLKDKHSFRPLVAVTSFAHSISIMLIFINIYQLWGLLPSILVGLLFASSFWSYQIILGGAFQGVAITFFLLGMFFLQSSFDKNIYYAAAYYFASGVSFGLMSFSSASARKLYLAIIAGYVYSTQNSLLGLKNLIILKVSNISTFEFLWIAFYVIISILITVNFHTIFKLTLKLFINNKLPNFINNNFFRGRINISESEYLKRGDNYKKNITVFMIIIWLYGIGCFLLAEDLTFYIYQGAMFLGVLFVFAILMAPNFLDHIRGFLYYWSVVPKKSSHQPLYQDYFRKSGVKSPTKNSAGGWIWYLKFHWLFTPHILTASILSILGLFILALVQNNIIFDLINLFLILLIAISPIIFGELTESPQCARTYYPNLLTFLIPVGYFTFELTKLNYSDTAALLIMTFVTLYLIHVIIWNFKILISDVWPARMSGAKLIEKLLKNPAGPYYAYDILQNKMFADTMLDNKERDIQVTFINSISEVKKGYLIVPGIIHLAYNVSSLALAHFKGDFRDDPVLNYLIDTGKIKDASISCFHTYAASRYWGQEAEMISYIDLIHKKISQIYRNNGRGWLLDIERTHKILGNNFC